MQGLGVAALILFFVIDPFGIDPATTAFFVDHLVSHSLPCLGEISDVMMFVNFVHEPSSGRDSLLDGLSGGAPPDFLKPYLAKT